MKYYAYTILPYGAQKKSRATRKISVGIEQGIFIAENGKQ